MGRSSLFHELSADLLSRGYQVRFRASGRSMAPTIRDGEAVLVRPVRSSEVRVGDIILYRSGRGAIAHRVVRAERRKGQGRVFIVRGDSSITADDPVAEGQVAGKVIFVERDGRRVDLATRKARIVRALKAFIGKLRTAVPALQDGSPRSAGTAGRSGGGPSR